MLVQPTPDSEQHEIHLLVVIQLVTLIIILRAPNRIDCHLLQPPQQRIADLVLVDESLVKSSKEDRHRVNLCPEPIYPVIIILNLSNLAELILSRELQGVKGDLHDRILHLLLVKLLSKDDHHLNKLQLQCSS